MSTQVLIETSEFNVVTAATQGPKGSTAEEFWEVRDQVTISADLAKDSELAAKTSELAAKGSELAAKDSELAALDSANTAAEASRLQLGMVTTEESGTASAQILGPAGQQVLNLGIPRGPTGAGGTIGSFLSALDTTTQPALAPNTPQRLNLNTVVEGVRVALVDGGRIVFYEPGTYSLTFSIQFTNSENNVINRASVWLKHNNEYYPNSASHFDIPALRNAKPGELVATVNFAATASENTWVEVWWEAQSTQVAATTIASTNGTPQAPSVILTVTQVMYTQTADVTPQLESLLGTAVEAKDAAITSAEGALESKQAAQLAELAALESSQLANAALLESQTQATKAEQQATKSEQQATTAQQQAQLAASAKESTQALLQAFQGVFLGSFSTDQLAEAFAQASGIVVQDGTMYQNTVTDKFRVYTGVLWQDYDSSAQQLQAAAQLSATSAATNAQEALQSKLAAQGFAQLTASDHEATEAARLQTTLDKQQTGLDRIQTGLDAQATAEDRIQTGLDRIATGEDRLATGGDRVQTSADRVQTGLDAQATAADRIKTTADAAATATDRAQTSLDAATSTAAADTATGAAAAALTSANAAIVAQNNAVAVVTGGTATLTPQAGKIPLADANAKIAEGWLTSTALVEQTDIGTAPNEIPLNQYLGNLAYMNHDNVMIEGGKIGGVAVQDIARTVLTGEELDTINSSAGLVLRGGGKNLLSYSEQFDNAVWSKGNNGGGTPPIILSNVVVAPDGTLTADKLVPASGFVNARVSRINGYQRGVTYTFSFFVKQAEPLFSGVRFSLITAYGPNTAVFWFSTETIDAYYPGVMGTSVTGIGNGWYKLTFTFNDGGTPGTFGTLGISLAESGDGTSGIYIWGAQLVEGTDPGPYVKTEADAVTAASAPAFVDAPNGLSLPAKAGTTPLRRGDITFDLASDTSLIVRVKGSDGTVRSTTLTLA